MSIPKPQGKRCCRPRVLIILEKCPVKRIIFYEQGVNGSPIFLDFCLSIGYILMRIS